MDYAVTLKDMESAEQFYAEMDSLDGILKRKVFCTNPRFVSRTTHYLMEPEEAAILRQDPRVEAVEAVLTSDDISPFDFAESSGTPAAETLDPMWETAANFYYRNSTVTSGHINWGLLRGTIDKITTYDAKRWGDTGVDKMAGRITVPGKCGEHVDVVIVDGTFDPTHPELLDSNGNERLIRYNWFNHNPEVAGTAISSYDYTTYDTETNATQISNNNHGAHVAGIVVGNTQGWARNANLYSLNPYKMDASLIFDYIRAFHKNKPINPVTGRKNPTVCNCSFGTQATVPFSAVKSIVVNGVTIAGPLTVALCQKLNIRLTGTISVTIPYRNAAIDADVFDANKEGIFIVAAAGNNGAHVVASWEGNTPMYSSKFILTDNTEAMFKRGCSPSAGGIAICVGAIATGLGTSPNKPQTSDQAAVFSNFGTRIDVYAAGDGIMSCVNKNDATGVADTRNAAYKMTKKSGTSQASPQIAGILACLLSNGYFPPEKALLALNLNRSSEELYPYGGSIVDTVQATVAVKMGDAKVISLFPKPVPTPTKPAPVTTVLIASKPRPAVPAVPAKSQPLFPRPQVTKTAPKK